MQFSLYCLETDLKQLSKLWLPKMIDVDSFKNNFKINLQILSLQDQLEKGPNAQLARLQQENSILRDALNQATSQAESK